MLNKKRSITLPDGNTLEVELTDKFLSHVRNHFNIDQNVPVDDYSIRMFIYHAVKNAVDKAMNDASG